jgi:hypothetical protein
LDLYSASSKLGFNRIVSNHFHSVKNFLFPSAKPHDFDGMLGTGLSVSIYTTKTPIDECSFNVTQLKEFFTFSVKCIKTGRFPFMMLTAVNKEIKQI